MSLQRILLSLFSRVKAKTDDENMVSIVLLLREPEILLQWDYVAAIRKSWVASVHNNVVVQGPFAFLRIGEHLVQVSCGSRPYFDSRASEKTQREWADHQAFVAVDHASPRLGSDARYAVIARLVLALLTENCIATFSPALGGLLRNDESLIERLRGMANSYKVEAVG